MLAQWGKAPAAWNDFYIGLTDDATRLPVITTAKAIPTGLHYRVRYINEGVDTLTNWYRHIPSGGLATNFINQSIAIGMNPAFNIYMLQEDGGANVAIANMNNLDFMRRYFWNIRNVAQKCNGKKAVFVIEPDTWGYLIKKNYGNGPTSAGGDPTCRPNAVFCNVNNLGYAHLAGLPNTMAGLAQGIIRTIRTYAPDAYIGFHANHWATWSNGATGSPCLGGNAGGFYQCQAGMPFWSIADINVGVDFQIAWYQELLGGSSACDKGDFMAVEKYGFDEGGRWIAFGASASVLYYGNTQYQNWLHWSKRLGQGVNLPLLGWQIPVGNSTLPNTVGTNKYKDGFMEYYFSHKQDFTCSGFIGLFMGPGVGASTFYTNGAGTTGDDGWLFSNLRTQLDPGRPLNLNTPTIAACAATVTPTCPLPVSWLSFSGKRKNGTDQLQWATAEETNNLYFEIEQSTDAVSFTKIGIINSTGAGNNYSWEVVASGKYYYRIKQVDQDGSFTFSQVITLNDPESWMVEIYPNPFSGNFNLTISSSKPEKYQINLLDLQGHLVLEKEVNLTEGFYQNEISASSLASGMYHLVLTKVSDGTKWNQKLVKAGF